MAYTTRKSLLEAIRSGDEIRWQEFYETYRPLIVVRGRDYHFNVAEINELVQAVMLRFFNRSQTFLYDRTKGRFRDYLGKMIYHCAIDIIRRRPRNQIACEEEAITEPAPDNDRWREEWRQHIMTQALSQLKHQLEEVTYQAFELYALKGEPPRKVAEFLKISVNMVYVAKSRAITKLRESVKQLQEID